MYIRNFYSVVFFIQFVFYGNIQIILYFLIIYIRLKLKPDFLSEHIKKGNNKKIKLLSNLNFVCNLIRSNFLINYSHNIICLS